jgi:hypothetical protein
MTTLDYKVFSRRHLPNLQPPDATLFVTYCLSGSIPEAMFREYKAKAQWFENEQKRIAQFAHAGDSPGNV